MIKALFSLVFLAALPAPPAGGEGKTVIINTNKAGAAAQTVTAPALEPSQGKKLRSAREEAEIQTESVIIEKLEAERLKDEQRRIDKMFNSSFKGEGEAQTGVSAGEALSPAKAGAAPAGWTFGNKAFVFGGVGAVNYLNKTSKINSTDTPAWFFGFGGYSASHFIIDLTGYYSQHIITENTEQQLEVIQPALSMSVKYSPFAGRVKPYLGLSAAYLFYRNYPLDPATGEPVEDEIAIHGHDRGRKKWIQAFDGGLALGADIALADNLGFNLDVRIHRNFWTESTETAEAKPLEKNPTAIVSGNLKYYF